MVIEQWVELRQAPSFIGVWLATYFRIVTLPRQNDPRVDQPQSEVYTQQCPGAVALQISLKFYEPEY